MTDGAREDMDVLVFVVVRVEPVVLAALVALLVVDTTVMGENVIPVVKAVEMAAHRA